MRGIVAAMMCRNYVGIDLRSEQVEENDLQTAKICPNHRPRWITGDAVNLRRLWRGRADFIFTCPPYGDLERYLDDPADLSNTHYDLFLGSFRAVIKQAARQLQDNRFTAFVVGGFRDKNGIYRGFVNDTVNACKDG